MRYPYVVFDIDGTLVNSEVPVLASLAETVKRLQGREMAPQELYFTLGIPGLDALEQLGLPDPPAALALWEELLREMGPDAVSVFPGVPPLLEALSQAGCRLGVVTSKTREEYQIDFCRLPISRHFPTAICAGETPHGKPSPEPLLRFMELTGAAPGQMLYVGDTRADAGCAQGAGVDFALALWGTHEPRLPAACRPTQPQDLLPFLLG